MHTTVTSKEMKKRAKSEYLKKLKRILEKNTSWSLFTAGC